MIDLIEHNPMLKKPTLTLLALCSQDLDGDRRSIECAAMDEWDEGYPHSPATMVNVLVRNGALSEQVLVDGEPYEGTLEDLQLDASVSDDAVAEVRLAITSEGRDLLAAYAPEVTLRTLLDSKPAYRDVFLAALAACDSENGCTRAVLEQTINSMPQLKPDPQTRQTAVYPQYFIDALETAGGIAWQGLWRITEAGRAALAA